MTSYVISPHAQADLDSIWDYVAADSPTAADRLLERFEETFALLARHPLMGQARDELRGGLRSFSVRKHVVYYEFRDRSLIIVRVIHGARDVRTIF